MESVSQIRDRIKICPEEELAKLLAEYEADGRDGVQKLLATGKKRLAAYEKELARTEEMWHYEHILGFLYFSQQS